MAEPPRPKSAQPGPPRHFTAGPPVQPAANLRRWLDREVGPVRPRPRLRLPIAIQFADRHRLALAVAHVSATWGDGLAVTLDDSALGIALIDRVRRHCPPDRDGCALWLEGYWGALLDIRTAGQDDPAPIFAVVSLGAPVVDDDLPLHALIETASPDR